MAKSLRWGCIERVCVCVCVSVKWQTGNLETILKIQTLGSTVIKCWCQVFLCWRDLFDNCVENVNLNSVVLECSFLSSIAVQIVGISQSVPILMQVAFFSVCSLCYNFMRKSIYQDYFKMSSIFLLFILNIVNNLSWSFIAALCHFPKIMWL